MKCFNGRVEVEWGGMSGSEGRVEKKKRGENDDSKGLRRDR